MTIAGLVNMAMLVMAAAVFHARGLTDVGDIDEAYRGLGTIVGHHADVIFGIALLASGLVVVERRHAGRPGRDAGLHQAPDPALPAPHRSR